MCLVRVQVLILFLVLLAVAFENFADTRYAAVAKNKKLAVVATHPVSHRAIVTPAVKEPPASEIAQFLKVVSHKD